MRAPQTHGGPGRVFPDTEFELAWSYYAGREVSLIEVALGFRRRCVPYTIHARSKLRRVYSTWGAPSAVSSTRTDGE